MDEASTLIARAKATTGLDDLGEDSFREGLDVLLASAASQARFHETGRAMFEGQLVDLLSQRLRIEHWYARHPEIDEQQIVAPVMGLGLPRTGSTALSCLLAEDPAIRYLRTWESQNPCPPPESATEHSDPRIAQTAARIEAQDAYFPRMKAMLPMSATGPIECQSFMGYNFASQMFMATARVPDYTDWLMHRADMVPTYAYLKRVLKLLQWRCPPTRWRLKNPSHSFFIDALDQVFPDARYWITHREITKVIPSVVDLYREMGGAFTDDMDVAYAARVNQDVWELGLQRLMAFRATREDRFFDVHFADIQHDPIAAVERLYAFLGEELTDVARAQMEAWRRDTPRDRHGVHRYDPAELGIDMDALAARFAFYTDRYAAPQLA